MSADSYFRVDIFYNNEWDIYSWHRNMDNAEDMGTVVCKSRQCTGRILKDSNIVAEITDKGVIR